MIPELHPHHPRTPSANSVEEYDPYAEHVVYDPEDAAADAAQELEDSLLGPDATPKSHGRLQRTVSEILSEEESDIEIPVSHGPKKRRLDRDVVMGDTVQDYASPGISATGSKHKGKGRAPEPDAETASASGKIRKKPGPKRKADALPMQEQLAMSASGAVSRDDTPVTSRPQSPAPTVITTVYELDEDIPPLRKARKVDDATMLKRVRNMEESQRKVWTNIARRDVGKVWFDLLISDPMLMSNHLTGVQVHASW